MKSLISNLVHSSRQKANLALVILFISFSGCDKGESDKVIKDLSCIPEMLHANVLAFYPFAGGSLEDFSGNGFQLRDPTGLPHAFDRFGLPDGAYTFDNIPDAGELLIQTRPAFFQGREQLSVSLWYLAEDYGRDGGTYEQLVALGPDVDCHERNAWALGLYDCRRPVYEATTTVWDEQLMLACETEVTVRTGNWHHLVATYHVGTKEMRLYVDGTLAGSSTENNGCPNILDPFEKGLEIGAGFTGKIDDIIFFNKVLTDDEVQVLTSAVSCREK